MSHDYTAKTEQQEFFERRVGHVMSIVDAMRVPRPKLVFQPARNARHHGRYFSDLKTIVLYVGDNRSTTHRHAEVLVHELGHHIDAHFGWRSDKYWPRIVGTRLGIDPTHTKWRFPIEDFADTFMIGTRVAMCDPVGDLMPLSVFLGARRAAALEALCGSETGKARPDLVWMAMLEAAQRA